MVNMMSRMIVIPDVDCMNKNQYETLIDLLRSVPIDYNVWEIKDIEIHT